MSTTPIRRALISVYDKTGLEELARGLHEADVALVSTGSTSDRIAASGVPVTPVEELTGFPECLDGRVKTLHPRRARRDPRRPAHWSRSVCAARPDLGRSSHSTWWSPTCTRSPTPCARAHRGRRVRRADRHRRSGDGARRGEEPRHRGHRSTSCRRYPDVLDAALAAGGFTLEQRQRLAAEAFVHTATYDVARRLVDGQHVLTDTSARAPAPRPGSGRPGTSRRCSATGRTRTSGPRCTRQRRLGAARSPPGWRRPSSCTARRCPTTTTSTPTPRTAGGVRLRRRADRGGRQARQPVRHRGRRRRRRGPPQGARVRPGVGIRRRRRQRTVRCQRGDGRQVAEVFTEVVVAPGLRGRRARGAAPAKKNIRLLCLGSTLPARGGVETRSVSGGLLVQARDAVDADGDDPASWTAGLRGSRCRRGGRWPTWSSPGGPAAR